MKLLVLTNNPSRASFRQRIETYLDILRAKDISCEVAVLPEGSRRRKELFVRCGDYDGVYLHKKRLNFLDARMLRHSSRKIIYDFDDAVMYSEKKPNHISLSRRRLFARTVRLAELVVAGNSYLAGEAQKYAKNVEVVPTGLKVSDFQIAQGSSADGKLRLVWIGSKSTLKYLKKISPALEEVGRRYPNVILRIICDDFFSLEHMAVEKKIWSLDSQAADLAGGQIGLAPLPDDPFTRGKCGFKILQYHASALAVVASPVGVNSEYIREGITGLLAENTRQWVDKLSMLIDNYGAGMQMGQAGRAYVQKNYDTAILGQRLYCLIKSQL